MDWILVWTIVIGAISGYVASRILGGEGYGFIGNIFIGIIGGILGKYLFALLNINGLQGYLGTMITSIAGAIILIIILNMLNRGKTRRAR